MKLNWKIAPAFLLATGVALSTLAPAQAKHVSQRTVEHHEKHQEERIMKEQRAARHHEMHQERRAIHQKHYSQSYDHHYWVNHHSSNPHYWTSQQRAAHRHWMHHNHH